MHTHFGSVFLLRLSFIFVRYFCTLREFLGIGVCHDTRAKITGLSKLDSDTLTEALLLKHYILKPYY